MGEPLRAFDPAGVEISILDVITLYLRHSEKTGLHSDDSRAERARTLSEFATHLGNAPVKDCKAFHLSDWVEAHDGWKSSSTRRSKAQQVNACFNWAAKGDRIPKNPFRSVRYEESERRPELPDSIFAEVVRCSNACYARAVKFLRLTALRLSELCEALWEDVDWQKCILRVPKHKSRKKTKKVKHITLVPDAMEMLRSMSGFLFPGEFAKAHIFLNTRGTPWNRRTLGQHLRRLKQRFNIHSPASLHGIRHQSATEAIAQGAPPKLVGKQLGHASVTTTERYYCHIDDRIDEIRGAFERGIAPGLVEPEVPRELPQGRRESEPVKPAAEVLRDDEIDGAGAGI